jgi:ASC-1-like (ASCH) protein
MPTKTHILRFRSINRDIFDAIVSGEKKLETRAATEKYADIKPGDAAVIKCGTKSARKTIVKVEKFKSIGALLKRYVPQQINPKTHTAKEARDMWYSFPAYKEKIRRYGLVVLHLK